MRHVVLVLVGILWATPGWAQRPEVLIYGNNSGTTRPVTVGSDGKLSVTGATTDADDSSIAGGQTNDNTNAFLMAYDGSVWRRLTFGTAGAASTQVLTVQGVASMTALAGNITQVGGATMSATNPVPTRAANSAGYVADDVAVGAASSGSPVPVGGVAEATPSATVEWDDGDRLEPTMDTDAFLFARDFAKADVVNPVPVAVTDGSSTSLIATSGTNVKTAITDIECTNSSSTWVSVDLRDATGGAVRWTMPVPNKEIGGGSQHTFKTPLVGTANTAWAMDPSASATTITCAASGYKIR